MSSLFAWTKVACLLLLASEAFASPIEKIEQLEKRAACTAYSMPRSYNIVFLNKSTDIDTSSH